MHEAELASKLGRLQAHEKSLSTYKSLIAYELYKDRILIYASVLAVILFFVFNQISISVSLKSL